MAKKRSNVRYSRVNPAKPNLVLREVDYIIARAAESDARFVTLGQLLFFSMDGAGIRVILGYPIQELVQAERRAIRQA